MRILVIETDFNFAAEIREHLEKEEHTVYTAYDGISGLSTAMSRELDMIIMERIIPNSDGVMLCRELLKRHDVPLIMLSDIHDRNDKILCFGMGTEEYMEKPVRAIDIVYRVRTIIKRQEQRALEDKKKDLNYKGVLEVDIDTKRIFINNREMHFTNKEYEIIEFFITHKNEIFARNEIYEEIWKEPEYYDTGYVTTYINRLRRKLSIYDLHPIKTIRNRGYMWTDD